MRERIGHHPELFHQATDPVEHRVDLLSEPIKGVTGARDGYALTEVVGADPVRDRGDVADTTSDVMGKNRAAGESEKGRDNERNEERAFQSLAQRQAFAGNSAADDPLPSRQAMHDDRCFARGGLSLEAEQGVAIAFLKRLRANAADVAHLLITAGIEQ